MITLPLWTIPVTIVLIPIAFVALRLTYFAVRYNFFNRVLKNVPRHPSLFGALDLFSTEDGVMGKLWEGINNPDGSVKPVVNLGPWLDRPYVTIQDPDAIKQILTSSDVEDYPKYDATYDFLRLILGDGLVTSKNPTVWHAHRRLLTPLFHFNILKNNAAVMIQSTRELLEVIQETGVGAYLPIKQTLSKHAMHIIIQLAFGDDFDVEWMTNFQLRALKLLNTIGMERLFFGDTVARILPFTAHRKGYHFRDQVTNAVKAAIVQRRARFAESGSAEKEERSDLLSLMIDSSDASNPITDEEIVDEALTFLFAGYDTTSSSLSWLFYHLSRNPDVMKKVQDELDAVLEGEDPTVEKIAKLNYTRNVVKESMRLTPVVPLLDRVAKKPVELAGYKLPAGTPVSVNVWSAQLDPVYWKEPTTFNPDRWTDATEGKHAFAYVPFSAGARNCIGQKFAMQEIIVTLSMLLQHYSVEHDASKNVWPAFEGVMMPMNLFVKFVPRQ